MRPHRGSPHNDTVRSPGQPPGKVLVTGGAGFIGSHVVDALRDARIEPRIFDLRSSPYHASRSVDTVIGDLSDLRSLTSAMEGCDAVVHLAAAADVDRVAREPRAAEATNARGTLNVLEAARAGGVRRVVYASTIWVYGDGCEGLVDEDATLGLPSHLYTATKLAGEMYCRSYERLYGLDYTILRFGIPYGPRARPAAVVPAFVTRALAGEPLQVAGEGLQSRRFVYVEDLADGVVRALGPAGANGIFNLVGERSVTIREVAHTVGEIVGDVDIVHTPARAADFGGLELSGERAATELGWRAATPFREGVRRYVEWHRAATAPEPARALRSRRLTLVPAAHAVISGLAIVAALTAYIAAVHAAGVGGHEQNEVEVVSVVAVVVALALGLEWRSASRAVVAFAAWALSVCTAIVMFTPGIGEHLRFVPPDEGVLLLSAVGAGLGATMAVAAVRSRPADDDQMVGELGG